MLQITTNKALSNTKKNLNKSSNSLKLPIINDTPQIQQMPIIPIISRAIRKTKSKN